MSKRRPSPDIGDRIDFTSAERRLELMEEWARGAIRNHARMIRVVVRPTPPPFLLPSRWGNVLYGPDGKPMEVQK